MRAAEKIAQLDINRRFGINQTISREILCWSGHARRPAGCETGKEFRTPQRADNLAAAEAVGNFSMVRSGTSCVKAEFALCKRTRRETTFFSSSAMSSDRLFLDRIGRHQSPSPLHRHTQTNTPFSKPEDKHDISTLP
jgi:hypothetical protein